MGMTFEEIKHVINNVQYDENGKPNNLEVLLLGGNVWVCSMVDYDSMLKNISNYDRIYRIKPVEEYVPYTAQDWREFLGKTFVSIEEGYGILVSDYDNDNVYIINALEYDYEEFYEEFVKFDGSPAGKKVVQQ